MKTKTLLLLASLAVFASSASAADSQPDIETVKLPTYIVTAPRYQPAEQQINASLGELRRAAQLPPAVIASELPIMKGQIAELTAPAKSAKSVRVAKS